MQLLGGGAILREVEAAAAILESDYQVAADVWSLTSVNELQREGKAVQRWNLLHPEEAAARALCHAIAAGCGRAGGGRDRLSESCTPTRSASLCRAATACSAPTASVARIRARKLREFFEVSREYIVIAALKALADEGRLSGARGTGHGALGVDPGQSQSADGLNRFEQKEYIVPVQQVTVPDIGGAEGAEVIEVLVAVGDQVALDQGLIVLESDKASMEIPSTVAGTVVELLVAVGDQLAEGAPVAMIEVASARGAGERSARGESQRLRSAASAVARNRSSACALRWLSASARQKCSCSTCAPVTAGASDRRCPEHRRQLLQQAVRRAPAVTHPGVAIYAGPAVRKLAREFGVQLGQVAGQRTAGSHPQGRSAAVCAEGVERTGPATAGGARHFLR